MLHGQHRAIGVQDEVHCTRGFCFQAHALSMTKCSFEMNAVRIDICRAVGRPPRTRAPKVLRVSTGTHWCVLTARVP